MITFPISGNQPIWAAWRAHALRSRGGAPLWVEAKAPHAAPFHFCT